MLLPHRQNVRACVIQPTILVAVRHDRRMVDQAVPAELLEALLYLTIEPTQLELFGLLFVVGMSLSPPRSPQPRHYGIQQIQRDAESNFPN